MRKDRCLNGVFLILESMMVSLRVPKKSIEINAIPEVSAQFLVKIVEYNCDSFRPAIFVQLLYENISS